MEKLLLRTSMAKMITQRMILIHSGAPFIYPIALIAISSKTTNQCSKGVWRIA